MSANKTEEVKRSVGGLKAGRASYCGNSDKSSSADRRYDNDEGGATGWFTHENALPGRQKACKR